jgi:hypothetical protein
MRTESILLSNLLAKKMKRNRRMQIAVQAILARYKQISCPTETQKIFISQLQASLGF